ncbi:sigma-70 family RNA polymerase sigma factor [Lactobacillus apis]|uniref:sigma-70 family RNA polymerase sigma factor n=1 Tax=Lactobacillus apis TaxID=303541 RepID=UPI00242A5B50|nr:sigma-70 family RNA polymerase sigma factor [Lactobacillus apis]
MKVNRKAFITAWQNQKLVRGALKSAHVRMDYTNYEDFLQEGIIIYAEMLTRLANRARTEVDRLSFRKIIWHTLDLLRKQKRITEQEIVFDSTEQVGLLDNWNNHLALEQEIPQLTQVERMLFFDHLLGGQTISALAQKTGINRVQLQRLKRDLLYHLREVLDN